jgi:O-antigen/teichoic acid export membrane protein
MNIIRAFLRNRLMHRHVLNKIIENISWLFLDKVLRMSIGLIVGAWVARYLGPEEFGIYSYATAFVGMFGAIAGLGLQSIVVRDLVYFPSSEREILGTTTALQIGGGLLAYVGAMTAIFFLSPDAVLLKFMVAILGSAMLFKFSEVAMYWFESKVLSKYIVWVQSPCYIFFIGIKICLIVLEAPLLAFAWAAVGEAFMVAAITLAILGGHGSKLHQLQFSFRRAKTLMLAGSPLLISGVANAFYMKVDQIMLGQMVGHDAVGVYSAAVRISEAFHFVPVLIAASIFPSILEAKQRDAVQYQRRLQRLYDVVAWLSLSIAILMTFLSTTIITELYGSAYAESGVVLAIHTWTSVFVFMGIASNYWFIAENRPMLSLQRTILAVGVNVPFNLILIPKFGVIGAAVASLFGQLTAGLIFDIIQPVTRPVFFAKLKSLNLIRSFGDMLNGRWV